MTMSMELQRSRMTPVLQQWDLGIVLEALSKPPYEPVREALKTVFLLAMTSARRIGEYTEDQTGHSRRRDRIDLLIG